MIAQKIAYNIIVSGIAKVLAIALALFGIGMLTRYLGPEGFGKYTIALAFFAGFSALGDFGLHAIATREISRPGANESLVLSKVFTLRLIISITVFLLTAIFVWFLPYTMEIRTAIFIMAGAFIFASSYGFLNGLFQKHLAMDRVALAEFIGKVIQMVIVVALVYFKLPFIFATIAILCAMISNFFLIYWFSRAYTKITLTWDTAYWKSFLRTSLPMGISAVATFLYLKMDAILLSLLQGEHAVGVYGAAYKIIETLIFFPAMVVGLVYPLFSRYIFSEQKSFLTIANTTLKFFLILIIPMVISVQFLAPTIIHIIGGAGFDASIPVLRILIFALAGIFIGYLFTNILIAANLQKKLMRIFLIAATLNIVANLLIIPHYSYIGAAMVSVGTEIFVAISALLFAIVKTPYTLALKPLFFLALSALLMYGAYTLLPFGLLVNSLFAFALYAIYVFGTRLVTTQELLMLFKKTS